LRPFRRASFWKPRSAAFDQVTTAPAWPTLASIVPNFDPEDQRILPDRRMEARSIHSLRAALRREAAKNDFDSILLLASFASDPRFQADARLARHAIGLDAGPSEAGKLLCQAAQSPLHDKINYFAAPLTTLNFGDALH